MSALSFGILFPLSFAVYLNRNPLSYALDASHKSYIHSELLNSQAWANSWRWVTVSFILIFILGCINVIKPFWPRFSYKIGLIVWGLVCAVVLGNIIQLGMSDQYETNNQKQSAGLRTITV